MGNYSEQDLYGMGWEVVSAARSGQRVEWEGETVDRRRFTSDTSTPEGRALELATMLDRLAPEIVSLEQAETVWVSAASEESEPWLATVAEWALSVLPGERGEKVVKWASQVTVSGYNREIQREAVITDTIQKTLEQTADKGADLSNKSLLALGVVAIVGIAAYGYSKGGA